MSRRSRAFPAALLLFAAAAAAADRPDPAERLETELLEELGAIGYLAGTNPPGPTTGVIRHERALAEPGLNFFTSGHAPVAVLMDMEGGVLHEWRAEFRDIFPYHPRAAKGVDPRRNFWRDAVLLPNGDIIVIWDLFGIFKLNRESRVLWVVPGGAHHDLQLTDDGGIVHLAAERRRLPEIPENAAIDDFIVVRDADGVELSRLALSEALRTADWPGLRESFWARERTRDSGLRQKARYDPFHTNSLRLLSEEEAARLGDPFRRGDALVSMAMLDTIAIVDMVKGSARWWQTGPFGMQHKPRVTPDGGIILFNNYLSAKRSSVQILNPSTRRVTWEYTGPESAPLFSKRSGGVEILPTGNILILESDAGRILQITPEREVAWEFRSPHLAGRRRDRVAHLYSVDRIAHANARWLRPRPDR